MSVQRKLIVTSKSHSAASSKRPIRAHSWNGWVGFTSPRRGQLTIKAFTSWLNSAHWHWKLPTRRVRRRCFCAATFSSAFIALRKPRSIARELVAQRTLPFDYGLLGDALVEQGRLAEAVDAYQRMVDLRPDLQSYSRVAYMRWLKGDLDGAIEVARLAARAASPLDPESASWSLTRLGHYYLQAGSLADAKAACEAALTYSADYPAALLLKSRFLLLEDNTAEATIALQGAVADQSAAGISVGPGGHAPRGRSRRRSRQSRSRP